MGKLIAIDGAPLLCIGHEDSVVSDGSCDGDGCNLRVIFWIDSREEGFDGPLEGGMVSYIKLGFLNLDRGV